MKKLLSLVAATAGVAVAGASFAASAPVMSQQQHSAQSTPWYVGVGLNYNAVFTDERSGRELDNSNIGGNIFVGYDVNKYFGLEGGFNYLGNEEYKAKSGAANKSELDSQWNLHLVGNAYLPVNKMFQPFVFGGATYMNGEWDKVSGSSSDRHYAGFGLIYGAGAQFNYNQFGVRVKYTQQRKSSANNQVNGLSSPKDYISLDVLYHFGQ